MGKPRAILIIYSILVAMFLGAADYLYVRTSFPVRQPVSFGGDSLVSRVAWYREHRSDYNLIFLGDSRTLCGIHPELIDPLLQTSSLNVSWFSNSFPTQLPIVHDLAPLIPKGTTVVWSIGAGNFPAGGWVSRVYPVGIGNALRYLAWGVPADGLADNVLFFTPALYFLSQRSLIRQGIVTWLMGALHVSAFGVAHALGGQQELRPISDEETLQAKAKYESDPNVAVVTVVKDGDRTTSLNVYFHRGSYYRVELDTAYFRAKQQEIKSRWSAPTLARSQMRLFEDMLRTFKENGVDVIINEMEETPFTYGDGMSAAHRFFMRNLIAKKVAEFGFRYVHVDFDRLTDEDYFDYNHLNSRGAETFIPMLADQLRPLLRTQASLHH